MSKIQNYFAEICKFTRAKLKKVDTHVKSISGQRWIEKKDDEGWFRAMYGGQHAAAADAAGFVLDLAPDLQLGEPIQGLFVGSQDAAADKDLLASRGITHVVNAATFIPNYHKDQMTYKNFDVLDLPDTNLEPLLEPCCEFIDDALNGGGAVLVHCNAGVSRSVSLVVAYLMIRKGLHYGEALARVQEVRPVANPNAGFRRQLQDLNNMLYGAL